MRILIITLIAAVVAGCTSSNDEKTVYRIAYNVLEDTAIDNYDIYIMDMDGNNKKNISNTPGVEWVYYTYKDKIFFISDRDTCTRCYFLYEMDADGNHVRKISDLQLEDSWMSSRKDGKELIVSGRIGKEIRTQLFLINVEDGSFQQITKDTSARYTDPLFSPDGKQIYLRYKKERFNRQMKTEIFVMNDDGSGINQLTIYPANDTTAPWHAYHAGPPQWNPVEKFISYQSLQDSNYHLFAITPDGKKQWKLTGNQLNEGWHSWSADGNWLAIEMFNKEQTSFDIYLMNWKTKELKKLADSWKYEQAPVFVDVKK